MLSKTSFVISKGNSVCAGPTVQSTPPPLAPAVPVPELAVNVYVLLL